ncbi:hypothetical protein SUGI_0604070 [Cryptomeria japonica]|nr:hypothetical protein SUGI_0604070 [Cryptomeria japonica]
MRRSGPPGLRISRRTVQTSGKQRFPLLLGETFTALRFLCISLGTFQSSVLMVRFVIGKISSKTTHLFADSLKFGPGCVIFMLGLLPTRKTDWKK